MENAPDTGQTYEKDVQEYAEFCKNCGLFLVDGIQLWGNALKAMGVPDRVIEVKLSSATLFVRRAAHQN